MARGVNGSANGAGHVPNGREAVEARLPGVSNLPAPVAAALSAVVGLRTTVPRERRSAQTLGAEREGHGVLIGDDGLIVTIGYLIMEADSVAITDMDGNECAADIVGYDYESGFGLVRAEFPIRSRPLGFGDSDSLELRSEAYVAGLGGEKATLKVKVAGRREFAGYWEYLLDTNDWFMMDSSMMKDALKFVDRVKAEFGMAEEFDSFIGKWRLYARYSLGWNDWRFILGSQVS